MSYEDKSLQAYDLGPAAQLSGAPFRNLIPRATPLRGASHLWARTRYVPGPQPEGTVRVVLTSASYEEPAEFTLYNPDDSMHKFLEPSRVFDLPVDRYERWLVARAAADAVEEEIESLISTRSGEIAAHRG